MNDFISGQVHSLRSSDEERMPVSLVHDREDEIDPAAIRAIKHIARRSLAPPFTAREARRSFSESRLALTGPLEPAGTIVRLNKTAPKVPPLTIFHPAGAKPGQAVPALLFFHGGGWTLGGLDIYEPLCRSLANATRSAIVWVDYRLAPEYPFPAAIEDAWAAAEWVQANAAALGLDPARIGVGGDSAGGNLAAVTAIAARNGDTSFIPAYQLLIYPCLDLTASQPSHRKFAEGYGLTAAVYDWYRRNYTGEGAKLHDWRLSPLMAASLADTAPAILLYAGYDILRDEAEIYERKLRLAGVAVETIYFSGMIHGFLTMGGTISAARAAIDRIGTAVRGHVDAQEPQQLQRISASQLP